MRKFQSTIDGPLTVFALSCLCAHSVRGEGEMMLTEELWILVCLRTVTVLFCDVISYEFVFQCWRKRTCGVRACENVSCTGPYDGCRLLAARLLVIITGARNNKAKTPRINSRRNSTVTGWCTEKNLVLNINKTKELFADFRKKEAKTHIPFVMSYRDSSFFHVGLHEALLSCQCFTYHQ